jgi:hypothetical protein
LSAIVLSARVASTALLLWSKSISANFRLFIPPAFHSIEEILAHPRFPVAREEFVKAICWPSTSTSPFFTECCSKRAAPFWAP